MTDVTVTCPSCQTPVTFPIRVDARHEPGALRLSVSLDEDAFSRVVDEHIQTSSLLAPHWG